EKGLHEALQFHQLELYYQPQVNEQHQLIGVEALIRWHHPEKGLLPPGIFMPVAEETGQILPIGRWIIEQACYQLSQWQKRGVLPE
ncbi:EAL domain-containing protein, partial [Guyparkeria sp. 1SP6A2]|nr:EAL domain-containing protein [Guyparkeria sp. 1SP6A2]